MIKIFIRVLLPHNTCILTLTIHVLSYIVFMQATIMFRMEPLHVFTVENSKQGAKQIRFNSIHKHLHTLINKLLQNGTSSIDFSHIRKYITNLSPHVIKVSTGWFLVLGASRMISTSKLQCIHPIGGSGTDLHDNLSCFFWTKCYPLKDFFQVPTLEHPCFAYWQTISLFHNVCYSCSALDLTMLTSSNNIAWHGYIMFLIIFASVVPG